MFWLVAAALSLAVALALGLTLLRARARQMAEGAESDLALYRDQLKEIERDLERGVLAPQEAEAARAEVARRLLAADRRLEAARAAGSYGWAGPQMVAVAAVIVAVIAAGALYLWLGAPGYPDMPLEARLQAAQEYRANRPRQAEAERDMPPIAGVETDGKFVELVEQLRKVVAQRPGDVQGLKLLAENEARLGNFRAAHQAQAQLIEALGEKAGAQEWADLAELMILAAGGYVSPEAEEALTRALRLDPRHPRARYYSGLALAQTGRPDIAYRIWSGLLQESREDDPWVPLIRQQLPSVAAAAGIRMPAPELRGPSAADVAAAEEMTPEERQEMIRGMVAGLAERLETEGGTPAEWARLIRAYGVLGETAKASEAWNRARETFAEDPQAQALLREAARAAEVAQ